MQIPRAIAGWRAFFRRTVINVFPRRAACREGGELINYFERWPVARVL